MISALSPARCWTLTTAFKFSIGPLDSPLPFMDSLSDAEIRDEFAYIPRRMKTGMVDIRDEDVPQPLPPRVRSWASPVRGAGSFDALPVEVLHLMFEHLDFLSLSRLSRVSRRGQELVASLPAYQDLLRHAPRTLVALRAMTILHLHSAKTLRRSLYSDSCVCCGNFGAFLFLIACERCCFECLSNKQAVWAMPRAAAAQCFGIPAKDLKALPAARSVPGTYYVKYTIGRSRPQLLVSVRAAKELALTLHGGTEASLAAHLQSRPPSTRPSRDQYWFAHLQRAQLTFEKHDPRLVFDLPDSTNDSCNGMASILFPVLRRPGNVEDHGSWCRGCAWVFREYHTLADDVSASLVPPPHHPSTYCYGMALREWSDEGFMTHARSCYGLQHLAKSRPTNAWDASGI